MRSWKIDDRDLVIMEGMMVRFVMVVIGKWSKAVVFVLEPHFTISIFSNPQRIRPPFQRPQKSQLSFLTPEIFRLKIIFFHINMQGCIAICRAPLRVQKHMAASFRKIHSGKESSFLVKDNLAQRKYG